MWSITTTVCLAVNPPAFPLEREELDRVYALPYQRTYHPMYEKDGGVPAIQEVRFSITHNRGCFGGAISARSRTIRDAL